MFARGGSYVIVSHSSLTGKPTDHGTREPFEYVRPNAARQATVAVIVASAAAAAKCGRVRRETLRPLIRKTASVRKLDLAASAALALCADSLCVAVHSSVCISLACAALGRAALRRTCLVSYSVALQPSDRLVSSHGRSRRTGGFSLRPTVGVCTAVGALVSVCMFSTWNKRW